MDRPGKERGKQRIPMMTEGEGREVKEEKSSKIHGAKTSIRDEGNEEEGSASLVWCLMEQPASHLPSLLSFKEVFGCFCPSHHHHRDSLSSLSLPSLSNTRQEG